MLSGVTDLMMMKSDVMDDLKEIKVCIGYEYKGQVIDYLPYDACTETMKPVYTTVKGWNCKIEGKIPQALEDYIKFIEEKVGVPIKFVSYSPDRNANIIR